MAQQLTVTPLFSLPKSWDICCNKTGASFLEIEKDFYLEEPFLQVKQPSASIKPEIHPLYRSYPFLLFKRSVRENMRTALQHSTSATCLYSSYTTNCP